MKTASGILLIIGSIQILAPSCYGMLTFQLSGYISEMNGAQPPEVFSVGQSWSYVMTYDENAEDSTLWPGGIDSNEVIGTYGGAILEFRFRSGSYLLEGSGGLIEISNNRTLTEPPDGPTFVADTMSFRPDVGGFSTELNANLFGFNFGFTDRDAVVFDSDALPTTTPNLELFESNGGSLRWLGSSDVSSIYLETTDMSVVPEPTQFALMVGLLGMVNAWFRRRMH